MSCDHKAGGDGGRTTGDRGLGGKRKVDGEKGLAQRRASDRASGVGDEGGVGWMGI